MKVTPNVIIYLMEKFHNFWRLLAISFDLTLFLCHWKRLFRNMNQISFLNRPDVPAHLPTNPRSVVAHPSVIDTAPIRNPHWHLLSPCSSVFATPGRLRHDKASDWCTPSLLHAPAARTFLCQPDRSLHD
jgi:hypothetical protein